MKLYHVNNKGQITAAKDGLSYSVSNLFPDFESAKMRAAELLVCKMRTNRQKIAALELETEYAESGIDVIQSMDESDFTGYWSAF